MRSVREGNQGTDGKIGAFTGRDELTNSIYFHDQKKGRGTPRPSKKRRKNEKEEIYMKS